MDKGQRHDAPTPNPSAMYKIGINPTVALSSHKRQDITPPEATVRLGFRVSVVVSVSGSSIRGSSNPHQVHMFVLYICILGASPGSECTPYEVYIRSPGDVPRIFRCIIIVGVGTGV